MAEWQYRIERVELTPETDSDSQLEKILGEFGAKGRWESAQIQAATPGVAVYRLIFKTEKPLD